MAESGVLDLAAIAKAQIAEVNKIPLSMRKKSLGCFSPDSPFRQSCIYIKKHPLFDGFILACIAFNCVVMSWVWPYDNPLEYADMHWPIKNCKENCMPQSMKYNGTHYVPVQFFGDVSGKYEWISAEEQPNQTLREVDGASVEWLFLIIYSIEMSIKMVAIGFFQHKGSYLRDAWNWIDFIVVVSAWLQILNVGGDGLGFLRTFRILRPLRTLNRFPALKGLVSTMFKCVLKLGSLGVLGMFFLVFFGIFGNQLFQGVTHGKCMIGGIYIDGVEVSAGTVANGSFAFDGKVYWTKEALVEDIWGGPTGPATATLWEYDPLFGSKQPPGEAKHGLMRFLFDDKDDGLCALNDGQFWADGDAPIFVGDVPPSDLAENPHAEVARQFGRKCDSIEFDGNTTGQRVTISRFCGRYSWGVGSAAGFFHIPTYGVGNFDSFLEACGTIWTSVTLEGWVDIMYALGEGFGQSYLYFGESSGYWVQGYFLVMVSLGRFILLNLVLSVIQEQYTASRDGELEETATEEENETQNGDGVYAPAASASSEEEGPSGNTKPPIVESGAGSDSVGFIPFFYKITEMAFFSNVVSVAILLNSITMGVTNYMPAEDYIQDGVSTGMPKIVIDVLFVFEWTFYAIFLSEMLIKWLGLGIRSYVKDLWNVFDMLIVFSATYDVAIELSGDGESSGLSVLRTFRLIRLFKLAFKSWPALRLVVIKLQRSFKTARWLMALLSLVIFIFGLAGMNVFGGRFGHCTDQFAQLGLCCTIEQRANEYVGEEEYAWGQVRYIDLTPCNDHTLRKMGPHSENPPRHHFDTIWWSMVTVFQVLTGENWNEVFYNSIKSMVLDADEYQFGVMTFMNQFGTVLFYICLTIVGQWLILGIFLAILLADFDNDDDDEPRPEKEEGSDDGEDDTTTGDDSTKVVPLDDDDNAEEAGEKKAPVKSRKKGHVLHGKSLGCLSVDNPVRVAVFRIIKNKYFESFILLVIVVSTVLLCYSDPNYSPEWLESVGYVITAIFLVECVFKMIALGFWKESKHTYLSDAFNKLDFFIVSVSVVELAAEAAGLSAGGLTALKGIRAMRGLRPLRAIKRFPGMMLVVQTILSSFPAMTAPFMILFFTYTVLGIFGTQNFAGKMNSCNDDVGLCRPGVWIDPTHPDLYCNPDYWPQEVKDYYESKEWFDMDTYKTRKFDIDDLDSYTVSTVIKKGVRGEGCLREIDFPYGLGCHERTIGNLRSKGDTNLRCDPRVWEKDYPFVASHYQNKSWYEAYQREYSGELDCRTDVDFPFGLNMSKAATEEVDVEHPDLYCNPVDWPEVVKQTYSEENKRLAALWASEKKHCLLYNDIEDAWAGSDKYIRGVSSVNSADSGCCSANVPFPFGLKREIEVGPACSGSFLIDDTELCGLLPFNYFVEVCRQTAYCAMLDEAVLEGLDSGSARSVCDQQFYMPRKWGPPPQNFDHLWSSIVTIYECSTGEMWPDIMYTTLDTVGLDQPMSYDYNLTWPAIFFIFGANFLCAFIMLNLPIAVVCDNYNDMKANEGTGLLTEEQMEWYEQQKAALRARPVRDDKLKEPSNVMRAFFYHLVQTKKFETTIIICIILNTITMIMNAFGDPYNYDGVLRGINFFFGLVFTIEAVCKVIAFDKNYLHAKPLSWNQFDFLLVLLFWIEWGDISIGFKPTFLRVLRVFRVLRLIKVNKEVQKTIGTLFVCLPQISNVLAVLALLVVVFAILGKELFWRIKMQNNINEYSNFRYFWPSFLLLFRAMTGESYNAMMHDCRVQEPYCSYKTLCYHDLFRYVECDGFYLNPDDPDLGFGKHDDQMSYVVCNENGCFVANAPDQRGLTTGELAAYGLTVDGANCGLPFTAELYFIVYFLFIGLMVLGIIVAIVLDANAESAAAAGAPVTSDHFLSFQKAWTTMDRTATGYINAEQLPVLLKKVEWPLGLFHAPSYIQTGRESLKIVRATLPFLHLHNGGVFFNDLLSALVSYTLGRDAANKVNKEIQVENSEVAMDLLQKQRQRKLPRAVSRNAVAVGTAAAEDEITIDQIIATVTIQSYYRRFLTFSMTM
jgi:hypothetical protein